MPGGYGKTSSKWLTPPEFVELLKPWQPIELDPCSHRADFIRARRRIFQPKDPRRGGLFADWKKLAGNGCAFVNPPWNNQNGILNLWCSKIIEEADRRVEIIALLPGYTDTGWYQNVFPHADRICALRGRLSFRAEKNRALKNPARFASHVFYFGRRKKTFERAFNGKGIFLK